MGLALSKITAACHQSPPPVPSSEMEGSTANLRGDLFFHEEVLVEILARLPARSLLRFKCVCKTWFSLIGSEYFAEKHLSTRSTMFKDYNFENLLVHGHLHSPDGNNGKMCLRFSAVDFNTLSIVHRKFKVVSSSPEYFVKLGRLACWFAGSCNGIVCLLVEDITKVVRLQQSLLLWNPATSEVKALQSKIRICVLGFGFDRKMNDYKVVCINNLFIAKAQHVFVYSSRSDSWKSLEVNSGLGYPRHTNLKFDWLDGYYEPYPFVVNATTSSGGRMLNWLGSCCLKDLNDRHTRIVISFDLSKEAFVMTPIPPEMECKCGKNHQNCHLIQNTPDEPCTVVCFPNPLKSYDRWECVDNEKIIHIWTLNKYGDSGSWMKVRSVVMFDNYLCHGFFMLWKGGEEVLLKIKQPRCKPQLVSYDPITQQLKLLKLKGWPCLGYTESLVSINRRYDHRLADVEDRDDDSKKMSNYYNLVLVDDGTGRAISRFHMPIHD
ncbi:hypothetical protein Dimus_027646 [Dionaea muscipula]